MAKGREKKTEKEGGKEKKVLGTGRGEGTTYSCLYSTVRRKAGTTYPTVRGRAKDYALLAKRQKRKIAVR